MSRNWLLLTVAAATICLTGSVPLLGEEPPKPSPRNDDPFAGKLLVVSAKSKGEYGASLEKVQVKVLAGKSFLVGTGVDTGQSDNWIKGRTIWIPFDDVAQLVEFMSLDELKKALSEAGKNDSQPKP